MFPEKLVNFVIIIIGIYLPGIIKEINIKNSISLPTGGLATPRQTVQLQK